MLDVDIDGKAGGDVKVKGPKFGGFGGLVVERNMILMLTLILMERQKQKEILMLTLILMAKQKHQRSKEMQILMLMVK